MAQYARLNTGRTVLYTSHYFWLRFLDVLLQMVDELCRGFQKVRAEMS